MRVEEYTGIIGGVALRIHEPGYFPFSHTGYRSVQAGLGRQVNVAQFFERFGSEALEAIAQEKGKERSRRLRGLTSGRLGGSCQPLDPGASDEEVRFRKLDLTSGLRTIPDFALTERAEKREAWIREGLRRVKALRALPEYGGTAPYVGGQVSREMFYDGLEEYYGLVEPLRAALDGGGDLFGTAPDLYPLSQHLFTSVSVRRVWERKQANK